MLSATNDDTKYSNIWKFNWQHSMTKQAFLILFFLISQRQLFAQKKIFDWSRGNCSFEGVYDTTKISEVCLKNSFYLGKLGHEHIHYLDAEGHPTNPEELKKLSIRKLDKQYKNRVKEIKRLTVAKSPFWEELRSDRLILLKETYEFWRIILLSYKKPKILKQFCGSDSCEYVSALIEGGDVMLSAWKKLAQTRCRNNSDSTECFTKMYLDKFNSIEKLSYARIQLTMFGLCNGVKLCNYQYPINDRIIETEFQKLFADVKVSCQD